MALNKVRDWIVAYDIRDPKRLVRVHRYMIKHAEPLQRSVFMARMSTLDLLLLREGLAELIDPRQDDIRMYPLPAHLEIVRLGRQDLRVDGTFLP